MALPRGRGHDRARTQDGEGTAIGRVGVAARLVPHLQAAMRVVVGQQLDQRVQDLIHLAGRYRRALSEPTPSGGSALAQAGETERLVVLEGALFLNGALGQGSCLQTFVWDRGATIDRPTVRPSRDPRLGSTDRLQL